MKETLADGQRPCLSDKTRVDGAATKIVGKRAGGDDGNVWLKRLEKRGAPEIAGILLPSPCRVGMAPLEELFLAPNGLGCIVGNGVEHAALQGEVSQGIARVPDEEAHLACAFLTIAPG
jgi:hypothetical protein